MATLELLLTLAWVVGSVLVGSYFAGRALPLRLVLPIFALATALLAFLAYRWYQSHVDYCRDSPEVAAGGDALSCLEPGNWAAFNAAYAALLLAELGLTVFLAAGLVNRWKRQRHSARVATH